MNYGGYLKLQDKQSLLLWENQLLLSQLNKKMINLWSASTAVRRLHARQKTMGELIDEMKKRGAS